MRNKVQVVIFFIDHNEPLKVLLLKTNKARGGFWQNITGSVEESESFLEAAQREAHEETGLSLEYDNMKEIDWDFTYEKGGAKFREKIFYSYIIKMTTIALDPMEHDNYKWEELKNVSETSFGFKSNYDAFRKACDHLENYFDLYKV